MKITGFKLIEINATIIVGLLILTTFQGMTPDSNEALKLQENQIEENYIEYDVLKRFFIKNCSANWSSFNELSASMQKEFDNCKDIKQRQELVKIENEELIDRINEIKYYKQQRVEHQVLKISTVLSKLLLIPFATSMIIESIFAYRNRQSSNDASKWGTLSFIIGLIFLGSVLTLIGVSQSYTETLFD